MGNSEATLKFGDLEVDRSKGEVHDDWNVSPGKLRSYSVTVFSAVHPASSKKRPFMEKALQASKVYRHPGILRYMDGGVVGSEIILVMEEATPILVYGLDNMSSLQIIAGLSSIIEALVFLHDKAGVSHNNVCSSSIYVTSEGIWKLWGLEYLCSFGDLTRDHIERINQYCNEKSIPPDDKSRVSPAYQHARDSYCFGKFIEDAIAPIINGDVAMMVDFLSFIRTKALHKEWTERPRLYAFCEHTLFQQDFLKLRHDVANVLLLPLDQRDQFIRDLPSKLKNYSDDVVASTLGSLLLSHSFLLIPSSAFHLMPALLTPKSSENEMGLFCPSVFKETIVPLIVHLYSIHDSAIRKVLLAHFQHYSTLISKEQLTSRILPQILLGIRDTDEELVASTLHSLAYLIPLLGADIVIGRNREQIFATAKPKTKSVGILKSSLKRSKRPLELSAGLVPPNKEERGFVNVRRASTDMDSTKELSRLTSDLDSPAAEDHSLAIPERSSPDGGEMTDEDVFAKRKVKTGTTEGPGESASEDQWSDWEEMLDQPTPDIVGVLEVKTSEIDHAPCVEDISPFIPITDGRRNSSINTDVSTKGSGMQIKAKKIPKAIKPQGLGEEYDIMSIKVEKKPDTERDFFADLTPNLLTKDYNLETMLLEASHKTRQKLPSLSDTLAELDVAGVEEGDDWNEEEECIPSEELLSKSESDKNDLLSHDTLLPLSSNPSQHAQQSSFSKLLTNKQDHLDKESSVFDDGWGQENWETF